MIPDSQCIACLFLLIRYLYCMQNIRGAVAATWVSVRTSFTMTAEGAVEPFLKLQDTLDGVYPGFLTALFVLLCWFLLAKKKMSPIKVMLLLVVIAFVGVLLGFFNPGLNY